MNPSIEQEENTTDARNWYQAIPLIIIVGLCAYCNSFNKAYVFDDIRWISGNHEISQLGPYLQSWATRPVAGFTFYLNHLVGGKRVTGYHVGNLVIHIIAALALFGIVHRTLLLERWHGRFTRSAPWLALTVALLWLVHPLNTQAVTYITQRCESLMGMFFLLTLYCAIRGLTATRPLGWYLAATLCSCLGMATKEVMAAVPLLVVLYDWTFLRWPVRRILRERWVLYVGLGCSLGVLGVRLFIGGTEGDNVGFSAIRGLTPYEYALTQTGVILYYIRLAFWPSPLCFDYSGWPVARSLMDVLLPGFVLLGLLLCTAVLLLRRSWVGFLGAWFFLILAPTSSILPIAHLAFEHRMYLSLIALIVLIVMSVHWLMAWVHARKPGVGKYLAKTFALLAGMLVFVLGGMTLARNDVYRTELNVYKDTIAKRPNNLAAHELLGEASLRQARFDDALKAFTEAEAHGFKTALTYNNMGVAWYGKGNLQQARHYYQQALKRDPNHANAHANLGMVELLEADYPQAHAHLKKAVQEAPTIVRNRWGLAAALQGLNRAEEAKKQYAVAQVLEPNWTQRLSRKARRLLYILGSSRSHLLLGSSRSHRTAEMLLLAEQACRGSENPTPEMLDTLSLLYAVEGNYNQATRTAVKGLKLARAEGAHDWEWALQRRLREYQEIPVGVSVQLVMSPLQAQPYATAGMTVMTRSLIQSQPK